MTPNYFILQTLVIICLGIITGLLVRLIRSGINLKYIIRSFFLFSGMIVMPVVLPIIFFKIKYRLSLLIYGEMVKINKHKNYSKKEKDFLVQKINKSITLRMIIPLWWAVVKSIIGDFYGYIDSCIYVLKEDITKIHVRKTILKKNNLKPVKTSMWEMKGELINEMNSAFESGIFNTHKNIFDNFIEKKVSA